MSEQLINLKEHEDQDRSVQSAPVVDAAATLATKGAAKQPNRNAGTDSSTTRPGKRSWWRLVFYRNHRRKKTTIVPHLDSANIANYNHQYHHHHHHRLI